MYSTARWRALRRKVLDDADWRCEQCGKPGRMEVHHRIPVVNGGARWDPDNLVALCRPCHLSAHSPGYAPRGGEPRKRTPSHQPQESRSPSPRALVVG